MKKIWKNLIKVESNYVLITLAVTMGTHKGCTIFNIHDGNRNPWEHAGNSIVRIAGASSVQPYHEKHFDL